MNILELDHIQLAIPVGGEAMARAFYVTFLGFEELVKPEPLAARGGCWFVRGSMMVHLGTETPFQPARKAHPAFIVADLDEAQRACVVAGIEVTPDTAVAGLRRFYVADPFGNRLEFIQNGEGFNQEGYRSKATRWIPEFK